VGAKVSLFNINEMIAILVDDFSDHQIIIASIYDGYELESKNIISLPERLLPF